MIITFIVNQTQKFRQQVELKSQNSYNEWIWELNAEEWMNIENNISNFYLEIDINKFQLFKTFQKIYVDISEIKIGKKFSDERQIIDNGTKIIKISIVPILPEGEKSYIKEKKEILSVEKKYPPFEWKLTGEPISKPSIKYFNFKHN